MGRFLAQQMMQVWVQDIDVIGLDLISRCWPL